LLGLKANGKLIKTDLKIGGAEVLDGLRGQEERQKGAQEGSEAGAKCFGDRAGGMLGNFRDWRPSKMRW
jgi:hypothetical protein